MYDFGRPLRRLCALYFLQGFPCVVSAGGNLGVETLHVTEDLSAAKDGYFSQPWLERYSGGNAGCEMGRGRYTWRGVGIGSNINMEKWRDISLICDRRQFQSMTCFNESQGLASHGWGCLFSSIPHVCVFDTTEAWVKHMRSANVSAEDLHTAGSLTLKTLQTRTRQIVGSLQELEVDHLGALAVMAKYLWSHMAPWLRNDVDAVVHAENSVEGLPFVGMHVRRGDKLKHEAYAVAVEEYLQAAAAYVEEDHPTLTGGVDAIKAIWVASDDPHIVDEVRALAPRYFPGISSEAIVYVYGKVAGGPSSAGVHTHTNLQEYGSFVYIMADLEQLAAADVFVGTFSSNVGRLVVLLREGLGKPRNSSLSLDTEGWYPGRQRRGLRLG